jgi:hydrogenase maturation protease
MPDLREQLEQCCRGRVCLVGVGNVERGDDGAGVRLAEAVAAKLEIRNSKFEGNSNSETRNDLTAADSDFEFRTSFEFRVSSFEFRILLAGTTPERFIGPIASASFDHVIFLDAVELGGEPGSVVFLGANEMGARFPQISTHRISLGTLAQWIEAGGTTRAWLLGVQPASLRPGAQLSPVIERTLDMLAAILAELVREQRASPAEAGECGGTIALPGDVSSYAQSAIPSFAQELRRAIGNRQSAIP